MRTTKTFWFAWAVSSLAVAAEPLPPAAPPVRRQPTLKDVDAALPAMRQAAASLPAAVGNPGPDHTGRTVEQDLAEYVFTEAALQRIARLREDLQAASPEGTENLPLPALAPLMNAQQTEVCRMALLGTYWQTSGRRDYHRSLVRTLVKSVPESQRQADLDDAQAIDIRAQAIRDKAAGLASNECSNAKLRDWLGYETNGVILDYNNLRTQIVEREVAAGRLLTAVSMTPRTVPCPPADATAVRGPGMKIRSTPDMRNYYPDIARKHGVEGVLRVTVETDAQGCVTAAGLERTSGSELLDQAGVRVAFQILFTPAEKDGLPVGSRAVVPLRFQLPGLGGDPVPAQRQP